MRTGWSGAVLGSIKFDCETISIWKRPVFLSEFERPLCWGENCNTTVSQSIGRIKARSTLRLYKWTPLENRELWQNADSCHRTHRLYERKPCSYSLCSIVKWLPWFMRFNREHNSCPKMTVARGHTGCVSYAIEETSDSRSTKDRIDNVAPGPLLPNSTFLCIFFRLISRY